MNNSEYAAKVRAAVAEYEYPFVTYDFKAGRPLHHPTMRDVEILIRGQLLDADSRAAKDGLSNVLCWGYATSPGIQRTRVCRFRTNVTDEQIDGFKDAVAARGYCPLMDIKKLEMPEFSGMSFTSKVLMFLSPDMHPVLDLKIAKFALGSRFRVLDGLTFTTTIGLTAKNMEIYGKWASWCAEIARIVNENAGGGDSLRAVDVERAIFWCINKGHEHDAHQLLAGPNAK